MLKTTRVWVALSALWISSSSAWAQPAPANPAPAKPAPGKPAAPAKPVAAPDEEAEEEAEEAEEEETPPAEPSPKPGPAGPTGPGLGPMPMWPQPGADTKALEQQRAKAADAKAQQKARDGDQVYSEQWWSHARPIFEIHGYFRMRAELFHNFSLGRIDTPNQAIWPMPADNHYTGRDQTFGPALCTPDEGGIGDSDDPRQARFPCKNKTQAGANIRFRLNPELHISDNLRVMSQIDLLDNLVLGSTPEGFSNSPNADGGYAVNKRAGYYPLGAFDSSQVPPSDGNNSLRDSVRVKRVWAEYLTPVGQLRFGRMPSHWGLGLLANAGDGHDDDYQTTADRILFVTGLQSIDLYIAGAWDFANEGTTSETRSMPQAQPYDVAQLDDVDQYVLAISRRKSAERTKLALAQGNVVLNTGLYVVHRRQLLANDTSGGCNVAPALNCGPGAASPGYVRRGAVAWIPDLWVQLLYKKFRFELEAVTIQGSIENTLSNGSNYVNPTGDNGWKLRQYGYALELEQKLVEDRLKLGFMHGWASGDGDFSRTAPGQDELLPNAGERTFSTFRFHPNYKVDLILNRNLLTRVQGSYYFRPSVDYDFLRNVSGQRFGGGFAAIWTRASQFVQTPGHKRDLGIELNLQLYYQAKDGALNDDPDKMGGFFTSLQYGVLFPLGGLGYQTQEQNRLVETLRDSGAGDTSTAQILRWYMGVLF
ncbi:MAG: TIGR04551 family protein [Polyangiaceae bacterium]|nr:TIGR04551 family protein [Polyangiaceae bacterium]